MYFSSHINIPSGRHIWELTDSDPIYEGELNCKVVLKKHQLTSLRKCIDLENSGICLEGDEDLQAHYKYVRSTIGIIGDKVGSGKSYIILALIKANPTPLVKFSKTYIYGLGHIAFKLKQVDSFTHVPANVIVVSHSLIKQWSNYIDTFDANLRVYVANTTRSMDAIGDACTNTDIVIVSASFYRTFQLYASNHQLCFNRIIFDEVDTAYTPSAKKIPAMFYWFMTASYMNVLDPYPNHRRDNSYSSGITNNVFAKSIFGGLLKTMSELDSRCLEKLVVKNDDNFVKESFSLEDPSTVVIKCLETAQLRILSGVTHRNILMSLNAGDERTAISLMNPNNVGDDANIVSIVLRDMRKRLLTMNAKISYLDNLDDVDQEDDTSDARSRRATRKQKLKEDVGDLETKISLVEDRIATTEACTICHGDIENRAITDCCQNSFCLKCILTWIDRRAVCPLCKKSLTSDKLFVSTSGDDCRDEHSDACEVRSKQATLKHLLQNVIRPKDDDASARKILICSEYDNSLSSITETLEQNGMRYGFLKGNGTNKTVSEFINGSSLNVLLVNAKSYGSGLNLQNTTDVVLMHRMSEDIEKQVIGRAQRPGRTRKLSIWKLYYQNEIHE